MPLFAPRSNATKKKEQLEKREEELQHAIRSDFPEEKLFKAVENLRSAYIAFLKAKLHWVEEARIKGKPNGEQSRKYENEIREWREMPVKAIIMKYKK